MILLPFGSLLGLMAALTWGLPRWHWGHLARPLPCPKAALGHSKESIRRSPPKTPLSGGKGQKGERGQVRLPIPPHPSSDARLDSRDQ